jgi:copper oxidase (laccase) domain-containing protein
MARIWSIKSGHPEIPMHDGHHLDLVRANTWLLEQCGVLPDNISVAGIDTYRDATFFSARREGIACGRTINAIRLIPNFPVY